MLPSKAIQKFNSRSLDILRKRQNNSFASWALRSSGGYPIPPETHPPKWSLEKHVRQDAVLLGDGREIWRLEPSGHLVSQDGRCLMADSTGVRLTGQCDTPGQAG